MKYIEALKIAKHGDLFLAGGITNCPDWQQEMKKMLSNTNLTVFSPRRKNFPIDDPTAARKQIIWEFVHLRRASTIAFWFPKETLCPIVLYELGAWSMTTKKLFIGVEKQYKRRQDVEIQTELARPEIKIVYSLQDLANQIIEN